MNISVRNKSILLVVAKITVTSVIFYLIAQKINVSDVLSAPVQNWNLLTLALAIALIVVFIQGLRWHLLCNLLGVGSDISRNIKAVWAGHLLNNVLPTSAVGDVLRSYSLRGRGAQRTQWVSALLVEKYFAVITALSLAGLMIVFGQLPSGVPDIIKIVVLVIFTLGASASLVLRLMSRVGASFIPGSLTRFLKTLSSTISKSVNNRTGIMTLVTSFLVNFLICVIFFCIAEAMGLKISVFDCLFIVPVFTILAGLPISYGGWGIREMTSIHLLQYFGVAPEIALFTTILFGITILLSSLPGLLFLPAFRDALIGKKITS
ncbi:MAG TPA: lysylphosphatidylglycerol synthase transmembrane domain-containing protein [Candidatus Paceibacterota bacterium]|nr:lysylphosphatidylglycerol synthase transmembrane domain-containing protein [Candidatus Paceibacterota bacterium]